MHVHSHDLDPRYQWQHFRHWMHGVIQHEMEAMDKVLIDAIETAAQQQ